ncbi:OmpH family outer membrane protein [Nitrosomonas marina]|uniref:Periplasmic chaperone for outer membrane proteins Skp n=1 Tax=Nitrosomonas marina TaxID=917 RepID=A0A1H8FPY6_9PROT|nr:OmpH family outer membrane protein [Nitrosomonas marina]SEN33650.1 periplasmic chaperone for outer membrane proteins Skp [Nitrosomonas marina]
MNIKYLWWKLRSLFILSAAGILLLFSPLNYAESIKIGVVNTEKILRESIPALNAQQRIDQEFIPRDVEIKEMAQQAKTLQEKLEKKSANLNETDRRELERELANLSRNYQRAQRQMREDLTVRQNEEYGAILELTDKAIHYIAEKENYDLILQLQDSVYRSQRIDITDQVIETLNTKKGKNSIQP